MTTFTWPAWYPDNCPPADAVAGTLQVYRLVAGDDVAPEDFQPVALEQPPRQYPASKQCQASGLSVYLLVEDARSLRRRIRSRADQRIAVAELDTTMGVTRPTPVLREPSHTTWWLPEGFDPLPHFSVIEEGGDA